MDAAVLRQWFLEGRINGQTLVLREGTADWKPCSTFPDLVVVAPPQLIATHSPSSSSESVSIIIPYKNPPALIAYYLGIFSIIPFIGILLGIAAFVLGIIGLKRAKQFPEARGRVHAWIGIVAGGFFAIVYIALIVLAIISAARA